MPSSLLELPPELLVKVFQHCDSGMDMVNLASSCQQLRKAFDDHGLVIRVPLFAELFGPLGEIIRVVTQPVGKPEHSSGQVHMAQTLVKKVTMVVNIASTWVNEYLRLNKVIKHTNGSGKVVRIAVDKSKIRLAFYRLWRYYRAFHCVPYDAFANDQADVIELRCELLRQWSHEELLDVQRISCFMRSFIQENVCPDTDAMVYRHQMLDPNDLYYKFDYYNVPALAPKPPRPGSLIPADAARATLDLYFLSAPPAFTPRIYRTSKLPILLSPTQIWDRIGSLNYEDLLDDMVKLDPGQILWLVRFAPYRQQVMTFLRTLDRQWFRNNPETFIETSSTIVMERDGQN